MILAGMLQKGHIFTDENGVTYEVMADCEIHGGLALVYVCELGTDKEQLETFDPSQELIVA